MPQRSCALIISRASFSRFLRLHRRLQAPPFSFLGKSLFLVSSKICRPFSSRAPCFVSSFPSRICAVHGYLFLFPSRFGSWPPAPSVRRLGGDFPDDVATLWEGDGLGAGASVASAAGAQEEPFLGGVAVPRDGHGSRRDAAAHVCVLLCSYECIFPFFSCTGSVHLLCAVVFAFPGPLALLLVFTPGEITNFRFYCS